MATLSNIYFDFFMFVCVKLVSRIPVSDAEELKKLAEKALATLKSWLLLAQEQLHTLGVDSAEDYYGLPFVWFQKVNCIFSTFAKNGKRNDKLNHGKITVYFSECSIRAASYNVEIQLVELCHERAASIIDRLVVYLPSICIQSIILVATVPDRRSYRRR